MLVHKFVSEYISSNTYIIEFENCDEVVLIDCGLLDIKPIIEWLTKKNKTPVQIILTHADSDHIVGVNSLVEKYNFELRCTHDCAIAIKSSKKNFSKYIDIFKGGFVIDKGVVEVGDGEIMEINDYKFHFIHTPGHTKACMCIKVNELLFSGDTLIKGIKTRINHRGGGNKFDLSNSIDKLKNLCEKECVIYPGHGEPIRNFFK